MYHCRYRRRQVEYHDLALVKVMKPIKFSDKVMPICLPLTAEFPDEKGIVYVAGWGLHHESTKEEDCTTGDKGPDPFSKCNFPFYIAGLNVPFWQCLQTKPPSDHNKGCKELLKLKQRKNKTANMLDKQYGRVSTFILLRGHSKTTWTKFCHF